MDKLTGIHAVREALEAGRIFDRIVIARGRDAADVAISTTFGENTLKSFTVWANDVSDQ